MDAERNDRLLEPLNSKGKSLDGEIPMCNILLFN